MASKINVPESEEGKIDPFDRAEIAAIVRDLNQLDISSTTPFVKFLFMTGYAYLWSCWFAVEAYVSAVIAVIRFEGSGGEIPKGQKTRKRKFPCETESSAALTLKTLIRNLSVCLSPRVMIDALALSQRAWKCSNGQTEKFAIAVSTILTIPLLSAIEKNIPIPRCPMGCLLESLWTAMQGWLKTSGAINLVTTFFVGRRFAGSFKVLPWLCEQTR